MIKKSLRYSETSKFTMTFYQLHKKWYLIEAFINYLQSFIVLYFEKRIHGH